MKKVHGGEVAMVSEKTARGRGFGDRPVDDLGHVKRRIPTLQLGQRQGRHVQRQYCRQHLGALAAANTVLALL